MRIGDPVPIANHAFVDGIQMFARLHEGGIVSTSGGVYVGATGGADPFFNSVFAVEATDSITHDLRDAVTLLLDARVPLRVHVPVNLSAAVQDQVAELGLIQVDRIPALVLEPTSIPAIPDQLEIQIVGPHNYGAFLQATAGGFGRPLEFFEGLYPKTMLEVPGLKAYVGCDNAGPAATGLGYRTGNILGIYSISTLPTARGRQYGTAMTWATMAGAGSGISLAVLQASRMGRPVYERMGFRLAVEYDEYEPIGQVNPFANPTDN